MASRDLKDLAPHLRAMAERHVAECKVAGIDLLIYCTYRSCEEQDSLYACGRTKSGAKVTNARGGQSKHNTTLAGSGKPASMAYDCVPCISGKPQWNDSKLYMKVGQIGEAIGLKWAGRWTGSLKETAHFEV